MHENYDVGYGRIALRPRKLTCIRQIICASITLVDNMDGPHIISRPLPPSRGQLMVVQIYVKPNLHQLSLAE